MQTLIKVCSQEAGGAHGPGGGFGGGRESPLAFAIASLAERMDGRADWLVLVKSLAVLHRLMSECGHRFVKSFATAPRPAAGGGNAPGEPALSPLQTLRALAAYRGDSSPGTHDYAAWVRSHASYLSARVDACAKNGWDAASAVPASGGGGGGSKARTLSIEQALEQLPRVHASLARLTACFPEGAAKASSPVGFAMALVLRDASRAGRACAEGGSRIAELFFDLPRTEAIGALDAFRQGARHLTALKEIFAKCHRERIEYTTSMQAPMLDEPSADFVATMEEYARSLQPAAGASAAAGASTAAGASASAFRTARAGQFNVRSTKGRNLLSSKPATGTSAGVGRVASKPPADAFAALSVGAPAAAADPFAAAAGGDPFGGPTSPPAPEGASASAAFGDKSLFGDDAFGGSAFGAAPAAPAAAQPAADPFEAAGDPFAMASQPAAAAAADPFAASGFGGDDAFGTAAPAEAAGSATLTGDALASLYTAGGAGSSAAPVAAFSDPFAASAAPAAAPASPMPTMPVQGAASSSPFGANAPSPYAAPRTAAMADPTNPFASAPAAGKPYEVSSPVGGNPFGSSPPAFGVPNASPGAQSRMAQAAVEDPFAALTSISPSKSAGMMGGAMRSQ